MNRTLVSERINRVGGGNEERKGREQVSQAVLKPLQPKYQIQMPDQHEEPFICPILQEICLYKCTVRSNRHSLDWSNI